MSKPNGIIIYRGPSLIDGSPIVAIATGLASRSSNVKTGGMVQTYILRADVDPIAAVKAGTDDAICGQCPHRGDVVRGGQPGKGRTCYVNIGQGPLAVYRALGRGRYPDVTGQWSQVDSIRAAGRGRVVRLGTYGDPAAVPADVWAALTADAVAHTGYTHQWRAAASAPLRALCMASVDSPSEASEAQAGGWRTFRVALPGHIARITGEARCPASAEAEAATGRRLTCETCTACGGANGRRGSIVIQAHGGTAVMANVRRRAA